tara:strand:- start:4494 stop:4847 length:354 start_codon:yes stop_codon:yes gene_type:complete
MNIKNNNTDTKYYLDDKTKIYNRRHNEGQDWLNVYYFVDRHNRRFIKYNKYFRKNSLYFISERSKNDKLFNYYKIVKPNLKDIDDIALPVRKNNIVKVYNPISKIKKNKNPLFLTFD